MVIAIDSSGIKVTNRGEWMREVWKVHRGWIKVHIAVNAKTKEVVGIEVTDERVGDSRMLGPLVDQSKENLQKKLGRLMPMAPMIQETHSISSQKIISGQLLK